MLVRRKNSTSTRTYLRFEDDELNASGRTKGAFSIRRRGGSQTDARDRLDYQVFVTNPITGATETVANGKTVVWQGTNDPQYLRQVVLPGGREGVLCVPAPIILKTPAFAASSKMPGITPVRYALSTRPVRYKEAAVNYVILDNNRFMPKGCAMPFCAVTLRLRSSAAR